MKKKQKKKEENEKNEDSNEESEENESYDSESLEESSEKNNEKFFIRKSLLNDIEDNDDNYYKVKTSKIKLSVYNYSQNIVIEINNYPKESKVEQIIKEKKLILPIYI